MVILTIDPSFKHLAITLYDGNKTFYMDMASVDLGSKIGFDVIFHSCHDLWNQLHEKLSNILDKNNLSIDVIASEIPPPVGTFSSGLYALDTYILSKLIETYPTINAVYTIPPSYLSVVHGTRKYKKSQSTVLAKYFLNEVFNNEYTVNIIDTISPTGRKIKGKLNNDKAESFIFMLRMMCRYNIDNKKTLIASTLDGLAYETEKLLFLKPKGNV